MEMEMTVVDGFTESVFRGNPAAVIITDDWLPDELMQHIAAENNLSETAFLFFSDASTCHIRWFSPLTEIAFCGHATLASAFVVFKKPPPPNNPYSIYSESRWGVLGRKKCSRTASDGPPEHQA